MVVDVDDYVISYINELLSSRLSSESPESFIILLTNSGVKLRYPSPLSCWSLCSCSYFKICLTETPLTTEAFNYRN